jgi:hypothetical protein
MTCETIPRWANDGRSEQNQCKPSAAEENATSGVVEVVSAAAPVEVESRTGVEVAPTSVPARPTAIRSRLSVRPSGTSALMFKYVCVYGIDV